jgi:hypothetical protein
MNDQNIISNKFDLNWSTSFSYTLSIFLLSTTVTTETFFWFHWVLNEADTFKSSSVLIYQHAEQRIYTQMDRHDAIK